MKKRKKLLLIWAIYLVVLLHSVVRIVVPNREYIFDTEDYEQRAEQEDRRILVDDISIAKGVYRFALSYQTDSNNSGFVEAVDSTAFSGGFISNGEALYADRCSTDFVVWLFDDTEELSLLFTPSSDSKVSLGELHIYETDYLWIMILAIELLIGSIGIVLQWKSDLILDFIHNNGRIVLSLIVVTTLAIIPFGLEGITTGADLGYHLARVEGVKRSLMEGCFPVRIEPSMLFNRGYADGIFYSDLFLYIPAIIRLLGFSIATAYNIFAVLLTLCTSITAYRCFSGIFKDDNIGLICSALYTTSANMLFVTMEGLLGQRIAALFLPVLLLAYYRLLSEDIKADRYKSIWPLFVIGYSGIIQSHILTCEITLLWTVVTCIVFARRIFRKETILQLVYGAAGTLIANAWFIVPFVDYYVNEDITIRHYGGRLIQDKGIALGELFSLWGVSENEGFTYRGVGLFFGIFAILFLGILLIRVHEKQKDEKLSLAISCFTFFALSAVMSLIIFPWDAIHDIPGFAGIVGNIQFPYRFLTWGTAFAVAMTGFVLLKLKQNGNLAIYYLFLSLALISIPINHLNYLENEVKSNARVPLYDETMMPGYIAGGEYIRYGTNIENLGYGKVESSSDVLLGQNESSYLKGYAEILDASLGGYVDFPLMYYKGYKAWDENGNRLVCGLGTNNVVRVEIPNGYTGTVSVKFVSPWYWRVCEVISALFIAWMVVAKVRKHSSVRCSDTSSAFQAPSSQGEGEENPHLSAELTSSPLKEEKTRKIAKTRWWAYGAVVYLTTPYMLYLLFEVKSVSGLGAYLLCPVILLVYNFADKLKYKWISYVSVGAGVILLAKFRPIVALMMIFTFVIMAFVRREWIYAVISFAGFGIGSILNLDFWKFVLLGTETAKSVPLRTIGSESYQLGQLLMSWTFFEGHPGIGFGIGLSLLALVWLAFFERERDESKNVRAMTWHAVAFIVASLIGPTWDLAARVSPVILRLLSEMGSPVELLGFALSLLLIPVVRVTKRFYEKGYSYISVALPLFSLGLALLAFVKWIILLK